MDFQNEILMNLQESEAQTCLSAGRRAIDAMRERAATVIHGCIQYRDSYADASESNRRARLHMSKQALLEGTPGVEIHADVSPGHDEYVVRKRRASVLSDTDCAPILRARGIDSLVLMGVTTSGCVLSTVRQAADLDFNIVVVSDACADTNKAAHGVLMTEIFPMQADVMTADEFCTSIS